MPRIFLFSLIFFTCSSPTQFESGDKVNRGPASIDEGQILEIKSESPISEGCSRLMGELLYLHDQKKHKKKN